MVLAVEELIALETSIHFSFIVFRVGSDGEKDVSVDLVVFGRRII